MSVDVQSECAHCGRELHFSLDSGLKWSFEEAHVDPGLLLFEPDVDWKHFDEPNIIHAY